MRRKVCKTFIGGSIPPRASKISNQNRNPLAPPECATWAFYVFGAEEV